MSYADADFLPVPGYALTTSKSLTLRVLGGGNSLEAGAGPGSEIKGLGMHIRLRHKLERLDDNIGAEDPVFLDESQIPGYRVPGYPVSRTSR